jgi:hypothetical protein
MLLYKVGELTPFKQRTNLGKTSGRLRLVAISLMAMRVRRMIMMLMVMTLVFVMLVIVMLVIVIVGGFAGQGGRLFRLLILGSMRRVLQCIVRCSGVNVEFHTGNSRPGLTLEMQVAIAELQF